MLEGLEITVLKLSNVTAEHLFFRLDSEHCQKGYLSNIDRIKAWPGGWVRLGDQLEELTGGATPLGAEYPNTGVRFLRVQNIMPNCIEDADMAFISEQDDSILSRSRLKMDDVLLTITGVSYGKAAVVTTEFVGSNINQHSVRMGIKSDAAIRPIFLATFLNALPGKLQSDQNVTGVTRPALDYQTLRNFVVPLCSLSFQTAIEQCVKSAHSCFGRAKECIDSAEETLLRSLGLENWQPPELLTYIRRASEALAAGRIDSDFFAPARYAALGAAGCVD